MRINKIMKKYFALKIKEQHIPQKMPFVFKEQPKNLIYITNYQDLLRSIIFHAALILVAGLFLFFNSGTIKSLEKIDPDNARIEIVGQAANDFFNGIQRYFYPSPMPTDKGGKP